MDAVELTLVDGVCPVLGLAADRNTHYICPHPGHRCRATEAPAMIGPRYQATHCLGLGFESCDRYAAWLVDTAAVPSPAVSAETQAVATVTLESSHPKRRALARRSRSTTR